MKKLLFVLTLGMILSCTPKTTQKVVEEVVPAGIDETVDPDCRTFDDLGNKKQTALEAFVLYRDDVKIGNFEEAYELWKTAFRLAPGSDGKKTYHYDDGVKIYTHFYEQATTDQEKKMWADSVIYLYERRTKCFGDDDYLAGRQAFDLYYNFKDHVDDAYIYELFKKAVDGQGEKASYFVVNPFVKMIVDRLGDGSISQEEGSRYANKMWGVIKYGTSNCKDNCDAWDIINSYAPDRLESLEAYDGFYDCTYYTEKYYPIYQANPTNCEIITRVRARLLRGNCGADDPKVLELAQIYDQTCRKAEPVEKGILAEAKELYLNGQYKASIAKYDEYLAQSDDVQKNANVNLFASKICYRDLRNFPLSRKYALAAAKLRPNWGAPFILIGKLYASSGPLCGPGTGFDSQVVTWPAIDKWRYAKKIDATVAPEANELIANYQRYMPSKEDIFSRASVTEGGSYTVGCWIQEKTTVRAAK